MLLRVEIRVHWSKSHFIITVLSIYTHTYLYVCSLILLSFFSITSSLCFYFLKDSSPKLIIICLVLLPFQEQTGGIQCYFT